MVEGLLALFLGLGLSIAPTPGNVSVDALDLILYHCIIAFNFIIVYDMSQNG